MNSINLEQLITENMKSIFGFALTRLGNVTEAEYLASDILYEIIRSAQNLKDEERFYGFMWKIAENVYIDYLRKKTKNASRTAELDENIDDEFESVLDEIVKKEELNLLRREPTMKEQHICRLQKTSHSFALSAILPKYLKNYYLKRTLVSSSHYLHRKME